MANDPILAKLEPLLVARLEQLRAELERHPFVSRLEPED